VIAVDSLTEHAYELALRACEGRRVAVLGDERPDSASPAAAGVEVVGPDAIADGENGAFDAVVSFLRPGDGRTVADAVEPVRQFAARGVPVVVALPCRPAPGADPAPARAALEWLGEASGGVTIVELRRASGSLIRPAGDERAEVAVRGETAGEPDALIGFANVDPGSPPPEAAVRLAPASRRSVAALERSVRALERANRSLARPRASRRTSAAASEIHRSTQLERRLLHLRRESPWVTEPIRIAKGLARRLRALLARFSR
jgi:hypothetical protein